MRPCSTKRWRTLSRTPEGLQKALHRQGDGEFDDRLQFAVLAALHGFEAMEFEAHDAVDDRHLAQSSQKYVVMLKSPSVAYCCIA